MLYVTVWMWHHGDHTESEAIVSSCRPTRSSILEEINLMPLCRSPAFYCLLRHHMVELPHYVRWQAFQGMHLHVDISDREKGDPICDANAFDHLSFVQQQFQPRSLLQPGETWRWPIPFPPVSQYKFRSADIIRSQLRSILATETRAHISAAFGLGDPSQTTNYNFQYREMDDTSWTVIFQTITEMMQVNLPVHFVTVAEQPAGDIYYFIVALNLRQQQRHFYFLVDFHAELDSGTVSRGVVTCAAPCLAANIIGLSPFQEGLQLAVYSYTPRERRRYSPEEQITDPTGTYLVVKQVDEDRLCLHRPDSIFRDSWHHELANEDGGLHTLEVRSWKNSVTQRRGNHTETFSRLPPPGNPVWWLNPQMEVMDDFKVVGGHELVLDYSRPLTRTLSLFSALKRESPREADPGQPMPPVKTISLSEAILEPVWCEIPLQDMERLLASLCQTAVYPVVPWDEVCHYLEEKHWEEFEEMIEIQPNEFETIQEIDIYTDGSFFSGQTGAAGWAAAETAICLAVDFGLVEIEPLEVGWIGATKPDARAGEATAMVRALEWAMAHSKFAQIRFFFDSQSVGYGADGIFGFDANDVPMKIARSLTLALRQLCQGTVQMNYVKAHAGNYCNDLADAFAKYAAKEQRSFAAISRPDYFAAATGPRSAIEYLWLYIRSGTCPNSTPYPTRIGENLILPEYHKDEGLEGRLPRPLLPGPHGETRTLATVKLSAVTYKVQSLESQHRQGRTAYLREQLAHSRFEVAFLQETRAKQTSMILSSSHIRLSAASVDGKGGTEIWLLRHRGDDTRELFPRQEVRALYSDNEMLIVRVQYRSAYWLLCSAHVPHSGHPVSVIEGFWNKLTTQFAAFGQSYSNFLLGIDANAHFAYADGDAIGTHGLEDKENISARCFKLFLDKIQGFLPSTFEWIHSGPTETWVSNVNGQKARCDYLVCPAAWKQQQIYTYLQPMLDEGNHGLDHVPLAISCILQQEVARVKTGVPSFDRRALQSADPVWLGEQFAGLGAIPWGMSVDRHATLLSDRVSAKLAELFPSARSRPRKAYISSTTWKIRGERVRLRADVTKGRRGLNLVTLASAFVAWQEGRPYSTLKSMSEALAMMRLLLVQRRVLAGHTKTLTQSLKTDRTRALEEVADRAPQMNPKDFADALRSIGVRRKKKPSGILPLPLVQDSQGRPVHTLAELAETWRSHFAKQEDGHLVEPLALLDQGHTLPEERLVPELTDFPTWLEVEAAFRRTSKNKAFFGDGIPGDLLSMIPAGMTELFLPLFLKEVLYQREALLYKGGKLVPAFKRGSPALCENYRSLFVSSSVGKALHSLYRGRLGDVFGQTRCSMQLGGLKGQGITQVSHTLHLYHSWANQNRLSFAVLFVDIQNAFYRLLREHIVSGTGMERTVRAVFDSLALPDDAYEEFSAFYEEGPALDGSSASPYLQKLFREFYSRTWFQVTGTDAWTQTHRGSRPGDSFADVCFGFALSKLLTRLESTLVARFPFLTISWNGRYEPFASEACQQLGPLLPVWADDLALALTHDQPNELLRVIPEVATAVLHSLAVIGLQPNMKPGKTELILDLRGHGSLRAKRSLAHQEYKFLLQTPLIHEALRVVGKYRHLGTIIQIGGRTQKDIQGKFGVAHDTITRYKSQIFSNRKLAIKAKAQLLQSLVISAITFNAAAWITTTKGQKRQIEASFDKLHKRVAVMHYGASALEWSSDHVYASLNLPGTETILRVSRLRYLAQMVRVGQAHFWALVQMEQRWYTAILEDLQWLQSLCTEDEVPDGSENSWLLMLDWAQRRPLQWKRLLKRAQARATAHSRRAHEWEQWHRWILDYLTENYALRTTEETSSEEYFCLQCSRCFASPAALAVHSFKKHARKNVTRYFVDGLQCIACLKHFASGINLQNHVKRSPACLQQYMTGALLIDPEPGVNSRRANNDKPQLPDPMMQGEGPRRVDPNASIGDPFVHGEVHKLTQSWNAVLGPGHTAESLLEGLRQATLGTCLFPQEIQQAFQDWQRSAIRTDELSLDSLQAFGVYEQRFAFRWFQTGHVHFGMHKSASSLMEETAAKLQGQFFTCYRQPVYTPVIFAHLFSGHRRAADVQECLERKGIVMISVDIIFNITLGDLNRPETFALFRRALEQNVLQGIVAGPPCETWSRARGKELSDGTAGPRVVRTNSRPYGRVDLSKREDDQVTFGSRLLAVAVKLLCVALVHGKTGVLEHPAAEDNEPHVVSVWKTAIMRVLQLFPRVSRVRVLQGHYGGKTVNPTDLLLVNVNDNAQDTLFYKRTTNLPLVSAIGKNTDGTWKTSELKVYPPGFCEAIATVCADSQPPPKISQPVPEWFQEVLEALNASFDSEAPMGDDFGNKGQRPTLN